MIFELLYTSVPKGLKSGSKGYCTVLVTEGIPSALQERLESFSGYRHLSDSDSSRNPVTYAHRIVTVAGNRWHILSRGADYGSDYSQRANLIAHHVAMSSDEIARFRCGPTALMLSAGLFRTEWKEEPRRVGESETQARLSSPAGQPRVSRTWAGVTGDAGWGGRLTQLTEESSSPISIVYPAGTEVIKLLDESACLLPPERQWDVTFNTFFIKSDGRKPAESAYVEAARTGRPIGKAAPGDSNTTGPKKIGSTEERAEQATNTLRRNKAEKAEAQAEQKKHEDYINLIHNEIETNRKPPMVTPSLKSFATQKSASTMPPPVNANQVGFEILEGSRELNKGIPMDQIPSNKNRLNITSIVVLIGVLVVVIPTTIFVTLLFVTVNNRAVTPVLESTQDSGSGIITARISKEKDKQKPQIAEENKSVNKSESKEMTEEEGKKKEMAKLEEDRKKKEMAKLEEDRKKKEMAKLEEEAKKSLLKIEAMTSQDGKTLIIPLDSKLREISKSSTDFERCKQEGVSVSFTKPINGNGSLEVINLKEVFDTGKNKPKKTIKASIVGESLIRITIPRDTVADDITTLCLAFSKTQDKTRAIQYFEPVQLVKGVDDKDTTGHFGILISQAKAFNFFAQESDNIKALTICKIANPADKSELPLSFYMNFRSTSKLLELTDKHSVQKAVKDYSGDIGRIIGSGKSYNDNIISSMCKVFSAPLISSGDPKSPLFKFTSFSICLPVIYYELSDINKDIEGNKQLAKSIKDPMAQKYYKDLAEKMNEYSNKAKSHYQGWDKTVLYTAQYIFNEHSFNDLPPQLLHKLIAELIPIYETDNKNNTNWGKSFLEFLHVAIPKMKKRMSEEVVDDNNMIKTKQQNELALLTKNLKEISAVLDGTNLFFEVSTTMHYPLQKGMDPKDHNDEQVKYKDVNLKLFQYGIPKSATK